MPNRRRLRLSKPVPWARRWSLPNRRLYQASKRRRPADIQRSFYNRLYGSERVGAASLVDRLIARFELHRGDAVAALVKEGGCLLDVGSGDGTLISRCASRFGHLVGIDVA